MKHLILGYGYCGYFLAKELKVRCNRIWTVSRSIKEKYNITGVTHLKADIKQPLVLNEDMNVIHYMIAPLATGVKDKVLECWLDHNKIKTKKIIYYGSSAVYGDHQGAEINEQSKCFLEFKRQYRRLNAEKLLTAYGLKNNIPVGLLRVAGIVGPNRIPSEKVQRGEAIIRVSEAPWTNVIYVKDLVNIALAITKKLCSTSIFNVSDGVPTPMGSTHRLLAILMKINRVYELSYDEYYAKASPLGREFLSTSKKLSIDKLKKFLGDDLKITDKIASLKESLVKTNPL